MPINNNGAALSTRHPDGCSGVGHVLSDAGALFYDQINSSLDNNQLDNVYRAVSALLADCRLSDADAEFLYAAIDKRRARSIRTAPGFAKAIGGALRGRVSIFPTRREQRSPDRQASYERRHRLAYSGVMPGHLAANVTHGEMAVMAIIANGHRLKGFCDMSQAEIGARAGVCRKTVQRALAMARRAGLISIQERPVPGRKHLTNLVRIISREWLAWIAKRRPASSPTQGDIRVSPRVPTSKTSREARVENEERGLAGSRSARFVPSPVVQRRRW